MGWDSDNGWGDYPPLGGTSGEVARDILKALAVLGVLFFILIFIVIYKWPDTKKADLVPPDALEERSDVVFLTPTKCAGNHGVYRWVAKTDETGPPPDAEIEEFTCFDMGLLHKPLVKITTDTLRIPDEKKWCRLKGRVKKIKPEEDGDIHVELQDASGKGPRVVVEIPLGDRWADLRKKVFGWTNAKFPLKAGTSLRLIKDDLDVEAIGPLFYDAEHDGKIDNRRSYDDGVTVWEIHPVSEIDLQ